MNTHAKKKKRGCKRLSVLLERKEPFIKTPEKKKRKESMNKPTCVTMYNSMINVNENRKVREGPIKKKKTQFRKKKSLRNKNEGRKEDSIANEKTI